MIVEVAQQKPPTPDSRVPNPASDSELLEAIAARRMGAFEALVRGYEDRLFGLAWRVTGSREDAEEVVQDALVKAHRALHRTYSETRIRELALRPWLFAITLNAARNRRRGERPTRSLDERTDDGRLRFEPVANGAGPAAETERHELREALELALGTLHVRHRAAIVVRMIEGLSYDEAAQALGRPVGTVKSDVHRGLRLLRQRLGRLLE